MFTSLWWNPGESGWGVTVEHQGDVMFLTFFIYKADGSPYWVAATLTRTTPGTGMAFPIAFSGPVNETHGPAFSAPYNAGQLSLRQVGVATFTATAANQATLTYSIDGATVTKSIQRQTLRNLDFSGVYLGGILYVTSACSPASLDGQQVGNGGALIVNQSGTALSIHAEGSASTCDFAGTYAQAGQLGSAEGTFSCIDGTGGTFSLYAMQWTVYGMSAGLSGQSQTCKFDGTLGGITTTHLLP